MTRYYDWQATFSRQTGTNGEICIVIGAKNIGKTFGLRLQCVNDYIKRKRRFCEICRTKEEVKSVKTGYFDKLQAQGYFGEYIFKVEKDCGYIARKPKEDDKPEWEMLCYFVALSAFQHAKKRTYTGIYRYIFDEAIIDRKDRYHRYLTDEYLILANILDTCSRQQAFDDGYKVYILGNACDLTCPYLQNLGIKSIPDYGYTYYRKKTVLLHYVEPWNADERKYNTLVGRMLQGSEEATMIFDNAFADTSKGLVEPKTSNARYAFAICYHTWTYAVWIDYKSGIAYITDKMPKNARNVLTITKKDASIDFQAAKKSNPYLTMISELFYLGKVRYSSLVIQETFLRVLDFLGIH